jgi:hypothetical protein
MTLRSAIVLEVVLVAVVAGTYGFTLSWSPSEAERRELERQQAVTIQALEVRRESVQRLVKPLAARRLDERDLPKFLSSLSELANRCGFELDLVSPRGGSPSATGGVATIDLQFRRPFPALTCYLEALERLPYLHGVQSISVSATAEATGASVAAGLDVALTLGIQLQGESVAR